MGIPEREKRENRTESIFEEIMVKNLPKPKKELDIQIRICSKDSKYDDSKGAYTKTHYNQTVKSQR